MSRITNIEDLQRELWIRERDKAQIVWKTKYGIEIPIKDMTKEHLDHVINMLEKKEELAEHYFEGEAADWESRDRT